jgi:hypothetical protein
MNKIIVSLLCIATLSASMPTQAIWYDWIPGISWFTNKNAFTPGLSIESYVTVKDSIGFSNEPEKDSKLRKIYENELYLVDNATQKYIANAAFSYDKTDQCGHISNLQVCQNARNQSYGSKLLKHVLEKLSTHCNEIYFQAYPYDLKSDQTKQEMLPKLISFYQRQGAQVISQNNFSANMVYYPKSSPRARQFTRLG